MSSATIEAATRITVWGGALAVFAMLVWILGDVLLRGLPGLEWSFLIEDPRNAGREGGIRSILVSTALVLSVTLAVATPLGLLSGILLADYAAEHPRLAPLVRRSLDTLAGVPSIVFGLFGFAVFAQRFDLRVSILTGGLTLAVMVLPFLIRSIEESLRSIPHEVRRAGVALGLSRTSLLARVLLPAALPGLLTGLVLGIGRALAETAALIFTSGYITRLPESVLDPGRVLSVHILDLAMNVPGGAENAARSAAILIGLLLVINTAVMMLNRPAQAGTRKERGA